MINLIDYFHLIHLIITKKIKTSLECQENYTKWKLTLIRKVNIVAVFLKSAPSGKFTSREIIF